MGIFLDVTAGQNRFFNLPGETPSENLNTPEGSSTMAALAGLAKQRNTDTDEPLESIVDRSLERIQHGDEYGLRQEIDDIASINEARRLRETQLEFIRGAIPGATGEDLQALINMEEGLTARDRPTRDFTLETEGVTQAQELGALDPRQESFFQDEEKYDVLNAARNHAVKRAIFADRLDKLQQEAGEESFINTVLSNTTAQRVVDLFLRLDKPKGSSSIELPGTRIQNLSNELWGSKTPEEFAERLDGLISRLRDDKGQTAPSAIARILSEMYAPTQMSRLGINAVAALDTGLSSLPVLGAIRLARNPAQLLNSVGNRSGAVNLTTDVLQRETEGARPSNIMTGTDAVAESLPTGLIPTPGDRLGAGMAGEVSRSFAKAQHLIDQVEIIRQRRLEPEQETIAIQQAREAAETLFGKDKILDMNQSYDPRSGLWTNHIFLGDEYGLPFHSREAALESAERRGLIGEAVPKEDWEVVDDIDLTGWTVRDELNEMGGGQLLRSVTSEEAKDLAKIQPPSPGYVRVFHGEGKEAAKGRGDKRWFTTNLDKAKGYAEKSKGQVSYVDLPRDHKMFDTDWEDQGVEQGFTFERELDAVDADQRQFFIDVEQNAGTGWTIRIDRVVREDGVLPPSIPVKDWNGTEWTEKLNNPAHFLPTLIHADRVQANLTHSRIAKTVISPLIKKIEKAGNEGLRIISKLYHKNQIDEKFYDEADFEVAFEAEARRAPSPAEKEAYFTGITLQQVEYLYRNAWMHEQNAARGMLGVSIERPGFSMPLRNGQEVVDGPGLWNSDVIFDVESGVRTVPGNNAKRYKDRWESGNYRIIKVQGEPVRTPDGKLAKYVFVNKAESKVGPLPSVQLKYLHAPHRNYANKFYGKQAVVEHLEDGSDILHNDMTHVVGTEAQLKKWAQRMERVRTAFNEIKDQVSGFGQVPTGYSRAVNTINDLYPGGIYKLREHVEAGKFNPETPFEVVAEGSRTRYAAKPGQIDWRDHDLSDYELHAITHRQMYYSEKGEHLRGVDGQLAETIDPLQTIDLAINNILHLKAFGAYNDKVVKEWARSAEAAGLLVDSHKSPWDAFANGTLNARLAENSEETRKLFDGLTAARNSIKRAAGYKSPSEMRMNRTRARVASWVGDKGPKIGKDGKKVGDVVATHLLKTNPNNPVNFLHRMTFVSAFFADASQIVVQPFTAVAANMIHPVHGMKSAMMTPWTTMAYFNKAPNLIDYIAKGAKAAGFIDDVDDYKQMVKTLQKSGWMNIGREQVELNVFEHSLARSLAGKTGKVLEHYGTGLVRFAEGINRMTAFQIAWRDTRQRFPNVSPDSVEFMRYLTQKADDLSWNMTRASKRAWQQGITGPMTVFQSYNANMIQNMLPKSVFGVRSGGNPRITAEQRARLVLGHYLLFGAAGIPGGFLLSEAIETLHQYYTGEPITQDKKRMMMRGMLDEALFGTTGANVDTAARVGVGQAIEQMMQAVAGGTFEKSALELVAGPPGRTGWSMLETVGKAMEYFKYEQTNQLGKDDFWFALSTLGNTFASFNRYEAAYWAWKTGFLRDKRTGDAIVGVNDMEKVFIALGLQPIEVREIFGNILDDNQKSQMAYKMAQQAVTWRNQALQAIEDGDEQTAQELYSKAQNYFAPIRETDPYMFDEILRITSEIESQAGTRYEQSIQRMYLKWGTPIPVTEEDK